MPPKKGKKRKLNARRNSPTNDTNETDDLVPPDRSTWSGWVEMESEPAFFNVMLKEMGVRDIKVQEVYSLDEDMLAILPQPIHALIFLFRYKDTDSAAKTPSTTSPTSTNPKIWFANQVPDFACASVALLNIIYNVANLHLGHELQQFQALTADMDPLDRGDAIDDFAFVKRIHNSFARESDLLTADYLLKQKVGRAKKRAAVAKARETREAKKGAAAAVHGESDDATKEVVQAKGEGEKMMVKRRALSDASSSSLSDPPDSDPEFVTSAAKPSSKPVTHSTLGVATNLSETSGDLLPGLQRRSNRTPKPRQMFRADSLVSANSKRTFNVKPRTKDADINDDEGFHFIAYMPIAGRIWKLDGLDYHPQDLGEVPSSTSSSQPDGHGAAEREAPGDSGAKGTTGGEFRGQDWMSIVAPALQERMHRYSDGGIEFNLMAIVHDPSSSEREALAANIKELAFSIDRVEWTETLESREMAMVQGSSTPEWRTIPELREIPGLLLGPSAELGITQEEIDAAHFNVPTTGTALDPESAFRTMETSELVNQQALLNRQEVLVKEQPHLRAAVRDSLTAQRADEERALHRRHDYGTFVRSWLGALVDCEGDVFSQLLET